MIALGEIGRTGNDHTAKVNQYIVTLIPKLEKLLDDKKLILSEYIQIGDVGVGEVLKALEAFNTHKSGKKIIVRLAEE